MQIKWIVALVTIWIFGAVFGSIIEGVAIGSFEESTIGQLMSMGALTNVEFFGLKIPVPDMSWLSAIKTMFLWDFGYFEGDWGIIRWLFLVPISVGIGLVLILQFASLVIQALRG